MFEFKVQGIPSEWKSKESYTITVECSPPLKSWNGSLKHVSLIAIPSLPFKTVELFHVSEPDLILFDHQTSFVFKQVRIDLTKINFKERVSLVCSIQIEWLDPMNPLFIPNQFKGYLFSCPFVVQSTTIDLSIEKSNCNSIDNNELIGLIESAITDSSHNTRLKYDLKRKFETVHNTTHINRKQPRKVIHIYTSNSIESGPVHSFPSHFDIDSWNIDTISIDQYGNVCFSGNSSVFDLNDDEDVSVSKWYHVPIDKLGLFKKHFSFVNSVK